MCLPKKNACFKAFITDDFVIVLDRDTEHQAYNAVPVEIVGTVVGSMVKESGDIFKFHAELCNHSVINTDKYRL